MSDCQFSSRRSRLHPRLASPHLKLGENSLVLIQTRSCKGHVLFCPSLWFSLSLFSFDFGFLPEYVPAHLLAWHAGHPLQYKADNYLIINLPHSIRETLFSRFVVEDVPIQGSKSCLPIAKIARGFPALYILCSQCTFLAPSHGKCFLLPSQCFSIESLPV